MNFKKGDVIIRQGWGLQQSNGRFEYMVVSRWMGSFLLLVYASGVETAPAFWAFSKSRTNVLMLHLYTRTCHVTSWVGWGGVGMLTYVALVHTHMPRHVLVWVGWGGDVNVRCTCTHAHATSRLGLGGVGWGCERTLHLYTRTWRVNVRCTCTHAHATSRLGLGGVGWGCERTLHLYTRTCHVTSWVGWGGVGMWTYVALVHTHMPRHVLGGLGWGCERTLHLYTRTCHVTSWVGRGGVGMWTYVALVHTHMPRHVLGWVGWGGDVNVRCTCTHAHATSRLGLGGVGWGCERTLHLYTRTCHVTSWVGWGGDVNVRCTCTHDVLGWVGWGGDVNVRCTCTHAHATSRLGLGGVGWGCERTLHLYTRTCHVTSWVGWGGVGMWTYVALVHTHEACNHSKGIFCTKKRIKNKRILIHTGGVDSMWRLSKSAIPCSLATRVNGNVNPKLMRSIRIWQWRWQNSKENVLEKTGRMLQKRMDGWKRKKKTARFLEKNPCKLQGMMLKPLHFPRENSMLFDKFINSVAMAKTTFFQKHWKRRRGFHPDGLVYVRLQNMKMVSKVIMHQGMLTTIKSLLLPPFA